MKKLWSSSPVLFLREALLLYFSRRVPQAAASLAYFVLLTRCSRCSSASPIC